MSTTLAQVVAAVRLRHPAFDKSRVPDPIFASAYSEYQNELIGKGVERDKGFCSQTQSITVNDSAFTNGTALNQNTAIIGGSVIYTDSPNDPEELHFTSFERRYDPPEFPAVYILNGTLYLAGRNPDWTDIASVAIKYIPIAAPFTALTGLFIVPDAAKPALVARGALEAAIRCDGLGVKVDVATFAALAEAAENNYLRTIRLSKRARHTVNRQGDYD